jgi:nitrogen fixation protein FixH
MVIFMLFISTLVYKMINSKVDLVAENYYESGVAYQEKIEKQRNADAIEKQISIYYLDSIQVLNIEIPQINEGKALIYRPSDKKFDFTVELKSKNAIEFTTRQRGLWKVKLQWKYGNKDFVTEKEIFVR